MRVDHYGYLGAVRDAKREVAPQHRAAAPTSSRRPTPTPFLCFNLGSELAAAGDAEGRPRAVRARLGAARPPTAARGELGYLRRRWRCAWSRACASAATPRGPSARAAEGLRAVPRADRPGLRAGAGSPRAAGEPERAADPARRVPASAATRRAATRRPSAAAPSWRWCELAALAAERDDAGPRRAAAAPLPATEHPGYLGSVLPLADGDAAPAARPRARSSPTVEARVAEPTPSVRFMLATALYEAGAAEAAEPLYRAVVEAQPGNGFAHLALAEALLSQRRYAEAAASRRRGRRRRRLRRGGRAQRAVLAPARRRAAGRGDRRGRGGRTCRPAEVDLFAAWAGAGGRRVPAARSATAPCCCATMLEALLRIEEFEAFEALAPGPARRPACRAARAPRAARRDLPATRLPRIGRRRVDRRLRERRRRRRGARRPRPRRRRPRPRRGRGAVRRPRPRTRIKFRGCLPMTGGRPLRRQPSRRWTYPRTEPNSRRNGVSR